MGRHMLRQPSQSITTSVTLTQLTGHATHSAYVTEVYLFVTNETGSDQLVQVQLVTISSAGSGGIASGLMVSRDDSSLDQWSGDYQVYDGTWTAAPTVGNVLKHFSANFSPGFHQVQWKPSSEQRFNAGATVIWGLHVPTAPGAAVSLGTEMEFYEG